MKGATLYAVVIEQPHSTIIGTPACSEHSDTNIALNDTLVEGQEEPGCVYFADQSGALESQSHSQFSALGLIQ